MATTQSSTARGAAAKKAAATRARDAVALLKADHRAVAKLFAQTEKASGAKKHAIVLTIVSELRVHMAIEEEIFYPASRDFVKDEDTVNEAIVEHQSAKDLMDELEAMKPSDEMYDAKVIVLQEMIEHHVEEEETEYFPEVQKKGMDTKTVGAQMAARKASLQAKADGRPLH